MKVTVNKKDNDSGAEYPCLMTLNDDSHGLIVLKISETKGIVVRSGNSWIVGDYYEQWGKHFKPFTGSITLEND